MMRNLLIATAALAALALPAGSTEAQMGGHMGGGHWRSGSGMHWQGARHWNGGGAWRGGNWGWRGHAVPRWNRHVWRGGPGWGWRSPRRVVIVGGGFGWTPAFWDPYWDGGWSYGYRCRTLWFDGWSWRCAW